MHNETLIRWAICIMETMVFGDIYEGLARWTDGSAGHQDVGVWLAFGAFEEYSCNGGMA